MARHGGKDVRVARCHGRFPVGDRRFGICRRRDSGRDVSGARRPRGGSWTRLDVYEVTVDKDTYSTAALAAFDTSGPVEVEVTNATGTMRSARVRPLSYRITPVIGADGKTATFVLPLPVAAHGLVGRLESPLPLAVYVAGAAIAVAGSAPACTRSSRFSTSTVATADRTANPTPAQKARL